MRDLATFVLAILSLFFLFAGSPIAAVFFGGIIPLLYHSEITDAINFRRINCKSEETPGAPLVMDFGDIFISLKDFVDKISKDKDVCDFVRNHVVGNIQVDGKNIKNPAERIALLLDFDIVYCFSKLELDIIGYEETKVLELYTSICDFDISTRNIYTMSYFLQLDKLRESNPDTLCLAHCLRNVDMDYCREYYSLLLSLSKELEELHSVEVSDNAENWIEELENDCQACDDDEKQEKEEEEELAPMTDVMAELDSLIGLDSVKAQVKSLRNFVQVMQQREDKGLKTAPVSYHCVFTGNPGTGKTTVARIVAQIYKDLGILKKGHLVETDRSGLVAEYVGQTAVKTNKLIDKALDGVLFIDEAYSLFVKDSSNDYGLEAIATLLKRMEDDRDRLVVILAGYTKEIQSFMEANPGLKSRFNRYIDFPDYTVDELYAIFLANIRKYEYHLTPEAGAVAFQCFTEAVARKDRHFGNGRFARNVFEKLVECQADRVSKESSPDVHTLMDILPSDVSYAFSSART